MKRSPCFVPAPRSRRVALAETGHKDQALEAVWTTIGPDGAKLSRDVFWLAATALFADVAAQAHDVALARLLAWDIEPCADHVVVFGTGGAVLGCGHHWLGVLAAALGDTATALGHLAEAVDVAQRIDAAILGGAREGRSRPSARSTRPARRRREMPSAHSRGARDRRTQRLRAAYSRLPTRAI